MCEHYIKKNKAWIRSLESIKAKNLIISIIEGDKILRKLIKFQLASKRTEILFNSKEAGKIFEFQVQTHTKRFTSNLHKQELLFNRFLECREVTRLRSKPFLYQDVIDFDLHHLVLSLFYKAHSPSPFSLLRFLSEPCRFFQQVQILFCRIPYPTVFR